MQGTGTSHRLHKTDRTRITTAMGRCKRLRYLEFHSGPSGYGVRPTGQSLPMTTGTYVHSALAEILKLIPTGATQWKLDRPAIRKIIATQVQRYRLLLKFRGFLDLEGDDSEVQYTILEQTSLTEGLVWGWLRMRLPLLLEEYVIILIESEETYVVGCSCGLGDGVGEPPDHEGRECGGILLMTRPDLVLQRRVDGVLVNTDFKTAGDMSVNWIAQWTDNVQLALGSQGTARRLGKEVPFACIHGLLKGARRRSKMEGDLPRQYTGPKRQESLLCYGWYRRPNPPFQIEDWKYSFNYVDSEGANRTLKGKGYEWVGVWDHFTLPSDTDFTVIEYWVESLPEEIIKDMFLVVGPLETPRHLLKHYIPGVVEEEKLVLENLWKLHDARAEHGEPSEGFTLALDRAFPQSRSECYRYNNWCTMLKICNEQVGMEDPVGSGQYELRRPHHEPELREMLERGIEPPPEQDVEEVTE